MTKTRIVIVAAIVNVATGYVVKTIGEQDLSPRFDLSGGDPSLSIRTTMPKQHRF